MALFARICVLRGFPGCGIQGVCLAENPCAALIRTKIAHL
jgi:hypothetical protein